MLLSLTIKNVVLIDGLTIEFKTGLCALTGETGAGKSILLDSLGLALGVRAESGLVRSGEEFASVTASFQINENHAAYGLLAAADIVCEDDVLLLRRMVSQNGKSRAFINDQPVSVALLKEVGETLVEIHGQFDTQGLLNPQTHRGMLDAYAKVEDSVVAAAWNAWQEQAQKLADLKRLSERSHAEEEYLKLSLEDLDALSPQEGEESSLSALRERLKHREQVLEALGAADFALNGENDPVAQAWSVLERVADKVGDALDSAIAALSRASLEVREAAEIVRGVMQSLQDTDYNNLEEIDERLFGLRAQARKHGCMVDDLPRVQRELAQRLELMTRSDDMLREQGEKVVQARTVYIAASEKVRAQRIKIAQKLDKLVQAELAPLKLEKARFVTSVEALDEVEWNAHGMDRVRFLVATNPGAQAGAIHKIASGGEMSRFMLALKVVIAQEGSTHSFIFDEVDTGIGGSTADAVGERLARLAKAKQVLVVTHAPQVAARADHHFVVEKSGTKQVKTTIMPLLSREARCEEIARMLAGAEITKEARAAASKLLERAA